MKSKEQRTKDEGQKANEGLAKKVESAGRVVRYIGGEARVMVLILMSIRADCGRLTGSCIAGKQNAN